MNMIMVLRQCDKRTRRRWSFFRNFVLHFTSNFQLSGLLHNNFTIVQEKVKRQEKEDYFCKLKRILFNIFVNQLFMMH